MNSAAVDILDYTYIYISERNTPECGTAGT
jgi:hypothetical protein